MVVHLPHRPLQLRRRRLARVLSHRPRTQGDVKKLSLPTDPPDAPVARMHPYVVDEEEYGPSYNCN